MAARRRRDIVDISLPNTRHALPAYYIVAPAEASSNLARYDGVRYGLREPGKISPTSMRRRARGLRRRGAPRVMIGTYCFRPAITTPITCARRKIRTLIKRDFETVFAAGVDAS